MRLLAIDTSTTSMSLALMEDKKLIAQVTTQTKIKHSTQLLPLTQTLFQTVKWQPESLEGVIIVRGPGSYTGLRVGVTMAKTLAWTLDLPLYSISSLQALAYNVLPGEGYVFTFINARRKTLFGAGFKAAGEEAATVLPDAYFSLDDYVKETKAIVGDASVHFVSPDLDEFEVDLRAAFGDQATFEKGENQLIHASRLVQMPLQQEDVHDFLPEYGKLAEAEEDWRANHPKEAKEREGHYVERTD